MDNSSVIKTNGLCYSYSTESKAVSSLFLDIKKGQIYGFLGPNGSGKTTTLRLLLGLLPPQRGSVKLFQQDLATNRLANLRRIGSLIESPSLYGHLSAIENLGIYRRIYGVSEDRVHQVLHLVGLEQVGSKPFKKYSLGMKQRLAIALALLPKPELLILDEPTNGLDPSGIIELRQLIKKLNTDEGMTIVISSHILAEVEKIVSHVGIIAHGQMMFQGSIQQLRALQEHNGKILIDTVDNKAALALLKAYTPEWQGEQLAIPFMDNRQVADIGRMLMNQGLDVYLLQPQKNDLEQLFINLINTPTDATYLTV